MAGKPLQNSSILAGFFLLESGNPVFGYFGRVLDLIFLGTPTSLPNKVVIKFLFSVVFQNICEWIFSLKVVRELFIDANGQVEQWRHISGLSRYVSIIEGLPKLTLMQKSQNLREP